MTTLELARKLELCLAAQVKLQRERDELAKYARELLDYTGGWDLIDSAHPIVKVRLVLANMGKL